MTHRLALALCELAARLLPPRRRSWGEAMAAELGYAEDDRAALAFAGGCLLAAARERARDFDTRFTAGLWAIALVSALFAAIQLGCTIHGVEVLFGARDGMLAALNRDGASPALIIRYERARPIVIACFLALGLAQFATVWLLARGELRRFWIAWGIALLIATVVVTIELVVVWSPPGLPSEFRPLLVELLALPALLAWSRGRHRQQERAI